MPYFLSISGPFLSSFNKVLSKMCFFPALRPVWITLRVWLPDKQDFCAVHAKSPPHAERHAGGLI